MSSRLALLLAFAAAPALASDKGLKAELVDGAVTIFCATSIAADLAPIVEGEHHLAIAKMSQESLKQQVDRLKQLWAAASAKHKEALGQLGLTARLGAVDAAYRRVAAEEAWIQIEKKCPERAKGGGPDFVLEFFNRRIPELK